MAVVRFDVVRELSNYSELFMTVTVAAMEPWFFL